MTACAFLRACRSLAEDGLCQKLTAGGVLAKSEGWDTTLSAHYSAFWSDCAPHSCTYTTQEGMVDALLRAVSVASPAYAGAMLMGMLCYTQLLMREPGAKHTDQQAPAPAAGPTSQVAPEPLQKT